MVGSADVLCLRYSVFLSPPWGGVNYQTSSAAPSSTKATAAAVAVESVQADGGALDSAPVPDSSTAARSFSSVPYSLKSLTPLGGPALVQHCLRHLCTPNLVLYIPRNTEPKEIAKLGKMVARDSQQDDLSLVQIEEEYVGKGLAALTCYFGQLAKFEE